MDEKYNTIVDQEWMKIRRDAIIQLPENYVKKFDSFDALNEKGSRMPAKYNSSAESVVFVIVVAMPWHGLFLQVYEGHGDSGVQCPKGVQDRRCRERVHAFAPIDGHRRVDAHPAPTHCSTEGAARACSPCPCHFSVRPRPIRT
jgi:hypothetical protein